MDGELDVRAAGLDADLAHHGDRGVAQHLVFLVGERLRRRDRDRVARVDAHRVEVLDRADDDDVVVEVAHHLELVFLPADDGFLDQDLVDRAHREALAGGELELRRVLGDPSARAAERERRPDDERIGADLGRDAHRLVERVGRRARGHVEADALHGVLEELAVLGLLNHLAARADHLDAVLLQHARVEELDGEVEARLAAERGQERVGFFFGDDLLEDVGAERLDVGPGGELGVRHDRCRVRVDQHDAVALGQERLARLRARVIELARLADHDRPRPDDEDRLDIRPLRHPVLLSRCDYLRIKKGGGTQSRGAAPPTATPPHRAVYPAPRPASKEKVSSRSPTWRTRRHALKELA